jgi:hypothetical protein
VISGKVGHLGRLLAPSNFPTALQLLREIAGAIQRSRTPTSDRKKLSLLGGTMQIRVLLNSQAENAAEIRTQLDAELHAALDQKGINITTKKSELEAGTLSIAEAYEFIISHGPTIASTTLPLVTAVLQLSNAILQRRGIKRQEKRKTEKKKTSETSEKQKVRQPAIVVDVDGKSIELPGDNSQLKRFLGSITKAESRSTPTSVPSKARVNRSKTKGPKRKAQK